MRRTRQVHSPGEREREREERADLGFQILFVLVQLGDARLQPEYLPLAGGPLALQFLLELLVLGVQLLAGLRSGVVRGETRC